MIPQVDLSIEIHLINQKTLDFASIKGYKKSKGWNVNDEYASDFNSNNLNFEIFEVNVLINRYPKTLMNWLARDKYLRRWQINDNDITLKSSNSVESWVDWILSLIRELVESWPSRFYWLWWWLCEKPHYWSL